MTEINKMENTTAESKPEITSFEDLNLDRKILAALKEMGFEEPSPIQKGAIPMALEGEDLIGQAQTGTGKTAAFGISIIQKINEKDRHIQALVMSPTRELCIQVADEISKIGKTKRIRVLPVYGGQPIERQIRSLKRGIQVVIGTPGRLLDHIRRGTIDLEYVNFLVLDEADEMLDMGFVDDMENIRVSSASCWPCSAWIFVSGCSQSLTRFPLHNASPPAKQTAPSGGTRCGAS